jgi:hypothetical protein
VSNNAFGRPKSDILRSCLVSIITLAVGEKVSTIVVGTLDSTGSELAVGEYVGIGVVPLLFAVGICDVSVGTVGGIDF